MGINQTFDVNRVTNLENRATVDEAVMLTTNNNGRQNIPYLNASGTFNAMVSIQDVANSCWWGIMQDSSLYNLAFGRFTAGSKAIEIRSYFDNLTIRTGRSASATSADFNLITNDQVVAGISANANLMPRGWLNQTGSARPVARRRRIFGSLSNDQYALESCPGAFRSSASTQRSAR